MILAPASRLALGGECAMLRVKSAVKLSTRILWPLLLAVLCGPPLFGFDAELQPILERLCLDCHGGENVKGKIDFLVLKTRTEAMAATEVWEKVAEVLAHGDMPPEDKAQPTEAERKLLLDWCAEVDQAPVEARPGPFRVRRLSGPEYRNTLRSLFGFELELATTKAEQTLVETTSLVEKLLPPDPPGASGFVNDTHGAPITEALFLRYVQFADAALSELFTPARREQLSALVGADLPTAFDKDDFTMTQAESLLQTLVPRAHRRPVAEAEFENMRARLAGKEGAELVRALQGELRSVLVSPAFLYRGLLAPAQTGQHPVDDFELAERLSYFLWADMPDDALRDAAGELRTPGTLDAQIDRMLADPKSRALAEQFGVEFLGLQDVDAVSKNVIYRQAIRSQPRDFLHYLFTEDRPVMDLVDTRTTFVSQAIVGLYHPKDRKQFKPVAKPRGIERQATTNQQIVLEHTPERGGILTMPGVLAMNRGPILRGTWILRRVLGEELGEPPPDVPAIKPVPRGVKMTFRERFEAHRENPSCMVCHKKIDPLGFALEGYDGSGKFITDKKRAASIDTTGRLPNGETFEDFAGLKTLLLTTQREAIVRNAVERTLAYALCRKLERADRPTVDAITAKILADNGTWRMLFGEIARSLPFQQAEFDGKEKKER